jgi:hypothetical protein
MRAGASPVIIANSVVMGAEGDWDWLVIPNDDLEFDQDDPSSCLSAARLALIADEQPSLPEWESVRSA